MELQRQKKCFASPTMRRPTFRTMSKQHHSDHFIRFASPGVGGTEPPRLPTTRISWPGSRNVAVRIEKSASLLSFGSATSIMAVTLEQLVETETHCARADTWEMGLGTNPAEAC